MQNYQLQQDRSQAELSYNAKTKFICDMPSSSDVNLVNGGKIPWAGKVGTSVFVHPWTSD